MSFSINTNVASLQAENYLTQTSSFQNKTIQQVTSGLRIVNSGDDAAGLAIANGDRSNEAVLTQGIQNATNGQNQLQVADGGMASIGNLLDTARSLAAESASGTFTGDRGTLNSEFQSVIGEINRQAQAIGLNTGGTLAQNLSVFIGGGESSGSVTAAVNGSVGINLSQATVDAKSLGLEGVQASGAAGTDIGTGSTTSVQNILNNATNQASISNNTTDFYVTGPGFSDTTGNNVVKLAINLNGVTDANTLATAVNAAIQAAGNGNSQQATAFKNANITASINTDPTGKQQLTFNSASTAFQVQGGDQVATALMGNFSSGSTGNVAGVTAQGATTFAAPSGNETVQMQITGAGLTGTQGDISVALTSTSTAASTVTALNAAIAGNAALAATGIQAVNNGGKIAFTGHAGQSFQVATAGDVNNSLGFGSFMDSAGLAGSGSGNFNYSSISASATSASSATTQGVQISINGGAAINLGQISSGASEAAALSNLNAAFSANSALSAAGITAVDNGSGKIQITSENGTNFRLNLYGGTGDAFGFGNTTGTGVANNSSAGTVSGVTAAGATTAHTQDVSITVGGGSAQDLGVLTAVGTESTDIATLNTAIAGNATLEAAGIQAVDNGGKIELVSSTFQSFSATFSAGTGNAFGFGASPSTVNSAAAVNPTTTAGGVSQNASQNLSVHLAGYTTASGTNVAAQNINLGAIVGSSTETTAIANLNAAFSGNAALAAAGLTASDNGGKIKITGNQDFTLNFSGGTGDAFGFGSTDAGSTSASSTAATVSAYSAHNGVDSAGAQQSQGSTGNNVYQFTGLTNAGDSQTITLSAVDSNGSQHSLNVNLNSSNASTIDQALSTINSAIQSSNDSTMEQIAAFKQEGTAGNVNGVEGITFMNANGAFKVSLGASPASSTSGVSAGLADAATGASGGAVFSSASNGTGSTADISNAATASAAVTALANAVTILGNAQASVGDGENTLTYAINLASSQLTNLAASESSIRDANMATESANLTKSQIQLQAGIAAMAQANSAPQQILSLLQGH